MKPWDGQSHVREQLTRLDPCAEWIPAVFVFIFIFAFIFAMDLERNFMLASLV
jgi:hypothetical protein